MRSSGTQTGRLWLIGVSAAALAVGLVFVLKSALDSRVSDGSSVGVAVADPKAVDGKASTAVRPTFRPVPAVVAEDAGERRDIVSGVEAVAPDIPPGQPAPATASVEEPLTEEMEKRARHFVGTDEKSANELLAELRSIGERAVQGDGDAYQTLIAVAQSRVCLSEEGIALLAKVRKPEAEEILIRLAQVRDPRRSAAAVRVLPEVVDRDRAVAVVSVVLERCRADGAMAPQRVRTACIEVMRRVRSEKCLSVAARELETLRIEVGQLEYGSELVAIAQSVGGPEVPAILTRYAGRLRESRPSDPVSGGYFDRKIAEALQIKPIGSETGT